MTRATEKILESLENTPVDATVLPHYISRRASLPTLRDQFAMAALPSMVTFHMMSPRKAAYEAYRIADAMLAARDVKREGTV